MSTYFVRNSNKISISNPDEWRDSHCWIWYQCSGGHFSVDHSAHPFANVGNEFWIRHTKILRLILKNRIQDRCVCAVILDIRYDQELEF